MKIRWTEIIIPNKEDKYIVKAIKLDMIPRKRYKIILENNEPNNSNAKVKLAFSVLEWSPTKRLNEPYTNYWGFELFNSYLMNDPVSFETKEEVEEYILENWNKRY